MMEQASMMASLAVSEMQAPFIVHTSSCCGVTPEHGWRRRAQDNALRRDLSESGLHVVDSLKLPPLSCDDRFEVRR